jgi:predicted RNase H-like HicB family nuclease
MKSVGYIVLTFKFHKEDRRWTAYCEELGTATFGRSLTEAQERIEEAVLLHLNTLEDVGERKRFFKENNITILPHKPKIKEVKVTAPIDRETFVHPYIQLVPA